MLGLSCHAGFSRVAESRLLIAVASLVAEDGRQGTRASVVIACELSSCSSQALKHRFSNRGAQASLP